MRRPWLTASIFLDSIIFMGDSALVRTAEDIGDNACQHFRDVAEWTYHLHRTPRGWILTQRYMSRVS